MRSELYKINGQPTTETENMGEGGNDGVLTWSIIFYPSNVNINFSSCRSIEVCCTGS